ncbi:alkylhydroperoxidase/carboxymuconolactone decarboxylase family protein YurZ [Bradyrhizobium sp. CIR48]|uniref:carboxymuconolactone decarboxylase family protein n=1 Tax=Bradyrhizobium sp. CIR48 TaxID=2663840 RepID=UPI0016061BC5|nr:carboxymuconolactone decarboxylase family protein [Bradyrhizobium sp. CIR48]MBB4425665.1 alkylhydroperoxidase/carboxymuconolactone decarboxylase family protein YurZ [Bradyrhizobium sp. CIR48]
MSSLTPEQQVLKEAYIKARGYWRPWTEGLLRLDPEFLQTYGKYAGYAAEKGPLSPKMRELIYVALDGSATHLFRSGLALHLRLALQEGASAREIVDVFRLATAQGLDGCNVGVAILAEELASAGLEVDQGELSDEQRVLRDAYVARFGDWPDFCEQWLRHDPGYFALLFDLLAGGAAGEGLDQRSQCLISIALNACFTALNPQGLRVQIKRALRLGIGQREMLQVLQMTAHLGVHACAIGMPVLMEALDERSSMAGTSGEGPGEGERA